MNVNVIRNLLRLNFDYILSKSIKNCHCFGLDSILFDDMMGSGVRLFIARPEHVLWKNFFGGEEKLSVAFHPHHCDIELCVVSNYIKNIIVEEKSERSSQERWDLKKYLYKSKILQGECKFEYLGEAPLYLSHVEYMYLESSNTCRKMTAKQLHSIWVPKEKTASWMVYSGQEDPNYQPLCWSNDDLMTFDDSLLYQPMTKERLIESLILAYPNL